MKFDKNKILTCVTADKAKVGQKGWFAILPKYIQENMSGGQEPAVLSNIELDSPSPFIREEGYAWPLFYPAPEPTYTERQAQWVMKNQIEIGTRVRITRDFTPEEDGSNCVFGTENSCKKHIVGEVGKVDRVLNDCIVVNVPFGRWRCPFTVLEIIKEPTYRPFTDDELNDLVGKVVTNKYTGYNKLVTERVANIAVRVGDSDCTAKDLFHYFTLDGKPCGVKEEV